MQKSKTGILFVVYQQIELDTFLPVAIELQSKKNYDIKFFFYG